MTSCFFFIFFLFFFTSFFFFPKLIFICLPLLCLWDLPGFETVPNCHFDFSIFFPLTLDYKYRGRLCVFPVQNRISKKPVYSTLIYNSVCR